MSERDKAEARAHEIVHPGMAHYEIDRGNSDRHVVSFPSICDAIGDALLAEIEAGHLAHLALARVLMELGKASALLADIAESYQIIEEEAEYTHVMIPEELAKKTDEYSKPKQDRNREARDV